MGEFMERFRRNFLPLDIILSVIQFAEYVSFGLDGFVFVVAGCMFGLDALLLIGLLSFKRDSSNAPRSLLWINLVSNVLSIAVYSIGRVFIIFAIESASEAKTYQRAVTATLFILFFPMKVIKIYIMFKYKKYCGSEGAKQDPKTRRLLGTDASCQ